jgi:hypothetical protein
MSIFVTPAERRMTMRRVPSMQTFNRAQRRMKKEYTDFMIE